LGLFLLRKELLVPQKELFLLRKELLVPQKELFLLRKELLVPQKELFLVLNLEPHFTIRPKKFPGGFFRTGEAG
jgi:hypothetical protein